jgi:hypothetical protein
MMGAAAMGARDYPCGRRWHCGNPLDDCCLLSRDAAPAEPTHPAARAHGREVLAVRSSRGARRQGIGVLGRVLGFVLLSLGLVLSVALMVYGFYHQARGGSGGP